MTRQRPLSYFFDCKQVENNTNCQQQQSEEASTKQRLWIFSTGCNLSWDYFWLLAFENRNNAVTDKHEHMKSRNSLLYTVDDTNEHREKVTNIWPIINIQIIEHKPTNTQSRRPTPKHINAYEHNHQNNFTKNSLAHQLRHSR